MHPLVLLGVLAAKKVVAYGVYKALARYGLPRAYRRLLEVNKLGTPPGARPRVQRLVKDAFYAPTRLAALLRDHDGRVVYARAVSAAPPALAAALGGLQSALAQGGGPLADAGTALLRALEGRGRPAGGAAHGTRRDDGHHGTG